MRVAIVAPENLPIPPVRGGSVQIYLTALVKTLAERGNVDVCLLSPGTPGQSVETVKHVVYSRDACSDSYEKWVFKTLSKLQADIIQVDNRPKLALHLHQVSSSTPVVLNLHSLTFVGSLNTPPKLAEKCLRTVHVVHNSRYLKQAVARRFALHSNLWDSHVIYPGVDLAHWYSEENRQPTRGEGLSLIFVGRVIRQKGVHVLVEAVRRLNAEGLPVDLMVIGRTPPWERRYRARVHTVSTGLPIRWSGFISPSKLPRLVRKADAIIVPSQSREAFGLVNLEAMAAGIPVIASRVGGIPEVVTDSCGILVDNPKSADSFATAIRSFAALSEDERKCLAAGAKKRALQFTWERTARQFERLYQSLM